MQEAVIASDCSQITLVQMELQQAEGREIEIEECTNSAGQVSTSYDLFFFLSLTSVEICIMNIGI